MKTVNLEHILTEFDKLNEISESVKITVLDAMREACEQTVDLCEDNVSAIYKSEVAKTKSQII